jgi:hypothetical protein
VGLLAAGGGGRKELSFCELSAGDRKGVACTALLGPRGGDGGVSRQWRRVEPRPSRGGVHAAGKQGGGSPVSARVRRQGTLYRRER